MASQVHSSILPTLFILSIILLLGGKASGGRIIPESTKEVDKKQPEWFFGYHGSIPIPGIGHVPLRHFPGRSGSSHGSSGSSPGSSGSYPGSSGSYPGSSGSYPGSSGSYPGSSGNSPGSSGGGGTGSSGGYLPGGDDTSVPNPGVEIPSPSSGGGRVGAVQMTTHP